ncbi:hypothetical protein HAX54_005536, partial [Datura stramonium]|nr:hypothetical protein [Datura stramonium]
RRTLPGIDMPQILLKERGDFGNADTGGAWLSSARATAGDKLEKGEDDVKSSCPLCPGRHTCYDGRDKGSRSREGSGRSGGPPRLLSSRESIHPLSVWTAVSRHSYPTDHYSRGLPSANGEVLRR